MGAWAKRQEEASTPGVLVWKLLKCGENKTAWPGPMPRR